MPFNEYYLTFCFLLWSPSIFAVDISLFKFYLSHELDSNVIINLTVIPLTEDHTSIEAQLSTTILWKYDFQTSELSTFGSAESYLDNITKQTLPKSRSVIFTFKLKTAASGQVFELLDHQKRVFYKTNVSSSIELKIHQPQNNSWFLLGKKINIDISTKLSRGLTNFEPKANLNCASNGIVPLHLVSNYSQVTYWNGEFLIKANNCHGQRIYFSIGSVKKWVTIYVRINPKYVNLLGSRILYMDETSFGKRKLVCDTGPAYPQPKISWTVITLPNYRTSNQFEKNGLPSVFRADNQTLFLLTSYGLDLYPEAIEKGEVYQMRFNVCCHAKTIDYLESSNCELIIVKSLTGRKPKNDLFNLVLILTCLSVPLTFLCLYVMCCKGPTVYNEQNIKLDINSFSLNMDENVRMNNARKDAVKILSLKLPNEQV